MPFAAVLKSKSESTQRLIKKKNGQDRITSK